MNKNLKKFFIGFIIAVILAALGVGGYYLFEYIQRIRHKELFDKLDSCRMNAPTIDSYSLEQAFIDDRVGALEAIPPSQGSEFEGILGEGMMKGIETFSLGQEIASGAEGFSYVGSNKMLPYGKNPFDAYMAQYSFVPFDQRYSFYPYRRYVRSYYNTYVPGSWYKHGTGWYYVV